MPKFKLSKLLIILSIAFVIFLPVAFFAYTYANLLLNCDSRLADFGFGEGKIDAPVFKEAGLEVDYEMKETFDLDGETDFKEGAYYSSYRYYPDASDNEPFSSYLSNFVNKGNCGLHALLSPGFMFFGNGSRNSQLTTSVDDDISIAASLHRPEKLDILGQKRSYNLSKRYKQKVEGVFSTYQLDKYGENKEIWVIQKNIGYESNWSSTYNHPEYGFGNLISFDAGENWLFLKKYNFPDFSRSYHLNKDNSDIEYFKKNDFVYTLDYNKKNIDYLYQIIEEKSDKIDGRGNRYFILDTGFVHIENTNREAFEKCDIKPKEGIFWIEVETLDRQARHRSYFNFSPILTNRNDECTYFNYVTTSFNEEGTEVLKQKLGL